MTSKRRLHRDLRAVETAVRKGRKKKKDGVRHDRTTTTQT